MSEADILLDELGYKKYSEDEEKIIYKYGRETFRVSLTFDKRLFKKRESSYIKRLSVFLWRIGYDRLWTGGRWKTCPYNRDRDCNASLSWTVICNCLHSLGNLIKI